MNHVIRCGVVAEYERSATHLPGKFATVELLERLAMSDRHDGFSQRLCPFHGPARLVLSWSIPTPRTNRPDSYSHHQLINTSAVDETIPARRAPNSTSRRSEASILSSDSERLDYPQTSRGPGVLLPLIAGFAPTFDSPHSYSHRSPTLWSTRDSGAQSPSTHADDRRPAIRIRDGGRQRHTRDSQR